jgi:hypothetical protein
VLPVVLWVSAVMSNYLSVLCRYLHQSASKRHFLQRRQKHLSDKMLPADEQAKVEMPTPWPRCYQQTYMPLAKAADGAMVTRMGIPW